MTVSLSASSATTAPTLFLDYEGVRFAYRRFGTPAGVPLVFTQHFMGNLAIARQGPDVGPLFGKRDELGLDMWLPIMFAPSQASQAAGRAFIARISQRSEDRDTLVSAGIIAAHRAAARAWASAPADDFRYLSHITQPALVVNGSDDIVIPTINSYHLYRHLPDAELVLFPDSGHGAHFQYVQRFVRRVIDFLDVEPVDNAA